MRKVNHITINRWFQKLSGNTYFTSYVSYDDGNTEQCIAFAYGYGDHGLYETLKVLAKEGAVKLPDTYPNGCASYHPTIFMREHGISHTINDVQRKKDM